MELARKFKSFVSTVPMLGWLLGILVAVLIEYYWGYDYISYYLGLPKIPVLFGALNGVAGVNCSLDEVDQETESIKITIEGPSISFESVKEVIGDCGAVIHSVDSVSSGRKLVEEVETPQDR